MKLLIRIAITLISAAAGVALGAWIGADVYERLWPQTECGPDGCWKFLAGGAVGAALGALIGAAGGWVVGRSVAPRS